MNGGATARGGRTGRNRSLRVLAVVVGLAAAAAAACLVLHAVLEPVAVVLPAALETGMVHCPDRADRATGVTRGFWIDRFEVTAGEYRKFLDATGRTQPPTSMPSLDTWTPPGSLPATRVTLFDARAFAAWRGKRLPTSPEWEWAARGSAGLDYPWSDTFVETAANTAELGLGRPTSVGTFYNGLSRFSGAYDLVGNVWEWTDSPAAGTIFLQYILRGGSFNSSGYDAMEAPPVAGSGETDEIGTWTQRGRSEAPDRWASDYGFRCAADEDAVERDRGFRRVLAKLGGRDPVRVVLEVRPALEELSVPEARRFVERALAVDQDPVVKRRLEGLLSRP